MPKKKPPEFPHLRHVLRKVDIDVHARASIHLIAALRRKIKKLNISAENKRLLEDLIGKWVKVNWDKLRIITRGLSTKKFLSYVNIAIEFLGGILKRERNPMQRTLLMHRISYFKNLKKRIEKEKPRYIYLASSERKGFSIDDPIISEILHLASLAYEEKIGLISEEFLETVKNYIERELPKERKFVKTLVDAEAFKIRRVLERLDLLKNEEIKRTMEEVRESLGRKSRLSFYDVEYIVKVISPILANEICNVLRENKIIDSKEFREKFLQIATTTILATTALSIGYISKAALEDIVSTIMQHKVFAEELHYEKIEPLLKSKEKMFELQKNEKIMQLCIFASHNLKVFLGRYFLGAGLPIEEKFLKTFGRILNMLMNRES